MLQTFAERLARAHPGYFTAAYLGAFGAQVLAMTNPVLPTLYGLALAGPFVLICLWAWAIYNVCTPRPKAVAVAGIFASAPLLVLVAGVAGWSTNNSPTALMIFGLLFLTLWLSASSLEDRDQSNGRGALGPKLLTTLLLYFGVVGIWVLHPRIARIAGPPPPVPRVR